MLATLLYQIGVGLTINLFWPPVIVQADDLKKVHTFATIEKLERNFKNDMVEFAVYMSTASKYDVHWLLCQGPIIKRREIKKFEAGNHVVRFSTPYTGLDNEYLLFQLLYQHEFKGLQITMDTVDVHRGDFAYNLTVPTVVVNQYDSERKQKLTDFTYDPNAKDYHIAVAIPQVPRSLLDKSIRTITLHSAYLANSLLHVSKTPDKSTFKILDDFILIPLPVENSPKMYSLLLEFAYPEWPLFVTKVEWWEAFDLQQVKQNVAFNSFFGFVVPRKIRKDEQQECRVDGSCTIECTVFGDIIDELSIKMLQPMVESNLRYTVANSSHVSNGIHEIAPYTYGDKVVAVYQCKARKGSQVKYQNITMKYSSSPESFPYHSRVSQQKAKDTGESFVYISYIERAMTYEQVEYTVSYYAHNRPVVINWLSYYGDVVTQRKISTSHVKEAFDWFLATFRIPYHEYFMTDKIVLRICHEYLMNGVDITLDTKGYHMNNFTEFLSIRNMKIKSDNPAYKRGLHDFIYVDNLPIILTVTIPKMDDTRFHSQIRYINFDSIFIYPESPFTRCFYNYNMYKILNSKDKPEYTRSVQLISAENSTQLVSMEVLYDSSDSSSIVTSLRWWNLFAVKSGPQAGPDPEVFLEFIQTDIQRMENGAIMLMCRNNTKNVWDDRPCSIHCRVAGEQITNISLYRTEPDGASTLVRYRVHTTYSEYEADLVHQIFSYQVETLKDLYQCKVTNYLKVTKVQKFIVNYFNSLENNTPHLHVHTHKLNECGSYFVYIERIDQRLKSSTINYIVSYRADISVDFYWLIFHDGRLIQRKKSDIDEFQMPPNGLRKASFTTDVYNQFSGTVLVLHIAATEEIKGVYITLDTKNLKLENIVRHLTVPVITIEPDSELVYENGKNPTAKVTFSTFSQHSLQSRIRYITLQSAFTQPGIKQLRFSDQHDRYTILKRELTEVTIQFDSVNSSTRLILMEIEFSLPQYDHMIKDIKWQTPLVIQPSSQNDESPTYVITKGSKMEDGTIVRSCRKNDIHHGLSESCEFTCLVVGKNIKNISINYINPESSVLGSANVKKTISRYMASIIVEVPFITNSIDYSCHVVAPSFTQVQHFRMNHITSDDSDPDLQTADSDSGSFLIHIKRLTRNFKDNNIEFTVRYTTKRNLTVSWLIYCGVSLIERKSSDINKELPPGSGWQTAIFTRTVINSETILLHILDVISSNEIQIALDTEDFSKEDIERDLVIPLVQVTQTSMGKPNVTFQVIVPVVPKSSFVSRIENVNVSEVLVQPGKNIASISYLSHVNLPFLEQNDNSEVLTIAVQFKKSNVKDRMVFLKFEFSPQSTYSPIKKIEWHNQIVLQNFHFVSSLPKSLNNILICNGLVAKDSRLVCRRDPPCSFVCTVLGEDIVNMYLAKLSGSHVIYSKYKASLVYKTPQKNKIGSSKKRIVVKTTQGAQKRFIITQTVPVEIISKRSFVIVKKKQSSMKCEFRCVFNGDKKTRITFQYKLSSSKWRNVNPDGIYPDKHVILASKEMTVKIKGKEKLVSAKCSVVNKNLPGCCNRHSIPLTIREY